MSRNPPMQIPKNPKKLPIILTQLRLKSTYHTNQIPIWIHDFIEKVVDVAGDGHCGFRAIAGLCNLSLEDHQMIHYQLHKEVISEGNARY